MGVSFITGRMGCDKTGKLLDLCFEEAKKKNNKPIYILVPEKNTYEMEKRLSDRFLIDEDPYFRIRVVSFSTLSKIVFTEVGGLKETKLTNSARSMLIYKAIESASNELKIFKHSHSGVGIVNKLMDIIIEFKQNNMTVDTVRSMADTVEDVSLKQKISDLARVYEEYETLVDVKYVDTEDRLVSFSNKLEHFESIKGATVFIAEYTGFTPIQYRVIEKIITYSKDVYFSLVTDLYNFNSRTGVFAKTNTTFVKINEFCQKNGIKRNKDIYMQACEYYLNDELEFLEKNIDKYNPKVFEGVQLKNTEKDAEINTEINTNKNTSINTNINTNINTEKGVNILEFENNHKEVEFVADEIVRLVRDNGYRYNEITVATRDFDSYSYIIKSIFNDYNIGYFLDEKISAKNNPIIVLILSILDMKQKNYSYDSVFRYLKSGLIDIDLTDISMLENYVLANGIKGKKWFDEVWDTPIKYSVEIDEESTEGLEHINEIKKVVMEPIITLHESLKGRNTVADICSYLYNFVIEIKLPEKIESLVEIFKQKEDLYKAKEYSQVWNIFVDMLDELVEYLGSEYIGLARFIKLMEAEFEGFELGIIPPARDQVFVTSIGRMKNSETKVMFLLGVNDGVFPKSSSDGGILSDREKSKLLEKGVKFDVDASSKVFDELYLVYKAFSTSRERLFVTYPVADFEGKALRPSYIIKKLKKIFPDLKVKNPSVEKESMDYISKLDKISSKQKLFEDLVVEMRNLNSENIEILKKDSTDKNSTDKNSIDNNSTDKNSIDKNSIDKDCIERNTDNLITDKKGLNKNNIDKNSVIDRFAFIESALRFFSDEEEYSIKLAALKDASLYNNRPSNLSKDFASELYGAGYFSVSKLEKYANCPFSYYMNYGLKLQERKLYEFSPLESGIYAHKVVDEFSKNVFRDNIDWSNIDEKYIEDEVRRIGENIVGVNSGYILGSSQKYKYVHKLWNRDLIDSLGIISTQIKRSDFKPTMFEYDFSEMPLSFNLKDGRDISLIGKIDRVDVFKDTEKRTDYISIIDYKSSTKKLDLNSIYAGVQMQLFLYMEAIISGYEKKFFKEISNRKNENIKVFDDLKEHKLKPAALLYSRLTNKQKSFDNYSVVDELSGEELETAALKENKLNGYVVLDKDILLHLDNTLDEYKLKSELLPITLASKGQKISSNTKGLSEEDFNAVREFLLNKAKDLCEEIYSGNIDIKPIKMKASKPCDYCSYKSICQFDIRLKGNKYNNVRVYTSSEARAEILPLMKVYNNKRRGGDDGQ